MTRYKVYPNYLNRLKWWEKLHHLKSQHFLNLSEQDGVNHLIFKFQPEFPIFPCECIYNIIRASLVSCNNALKSLHVICLGFQNREKVIWFIFCFAAMLPVMLPQAEVVDWSCSVSTRAAGWWARLWWQDKRWRAAGTVMFHLTQPWYPCLLGHVRWRRTGDRLPQTQIFAEQEKCNKSQGTWR